MSDSNSNASPAGQSDDNPVSGDGAPDGTKTKSKEEVEAELTEAIKRRDSASKRARELEQWKRDREAEDQRRADDEAAKSKDLDKIRENYKNDLAKSSQKTQAAEAELRSYIIRNEVAKVANGKVEGFEIFQQVTEAQGLFDIEKDDDGRTRVIVKDQPDKPLSLWLEEYLVKNPIFKRNNRQPGAGAAAGAAENDRTSRSNSPTIADVEKSGDHGREAFKKNAALAEDVLRKTNLLKISGL